MRKSFIWMFLILFTQVPQAFSNEGSLDRMRQAEPASVAQEIQKLTGVVRCQEYSHGSTHDCDLEIVEDSTGNQMDIVESPDLLKRHCQNDRELRVSLTAEKTPRFLFWGGNLKVKNFEILEELRPMRKSALLSERPRVRIRGGN